MHTNYPYCTALKNFCWNNGKFSQVAASYNDQNGASLISCMLSNEQVAKIVDVAGTRTRLEPSHDCSCRKHWANCFSHT